MTDLVPSRIARARQRQLLSAQRRISRAKLRARIGTEVEVLVDGVDEETELLLEGRWWGQAPEVDGKVHLANGDASAGEFRRAVITHAADHELVADLLDASGHRSSPLCDDESDEGVPAVAAEIEA
jgi:ribosomal protein S12 methylthiotransferase